MRRHLAREMVVEVTAARAAREQPLQRVNIARKGDVEHGDRVARLRLNALEQRDIALRPGDQHARPRLGKAQLVQRADAIGIAVENIIKYRHGYR